MAFKMADDGD